MSAPTHLAFISFFVGDIQGGLGPFLSTWLAQSEDWNADRIGLVTTITGFATLLLSGPLGALVDRYAWPRVILGGACALVLAGTLLLLPARGFYGVLLAQFLAATGGTLLVSALASLTLGVVGKRAFPRQQGHNQAWNHAGIIVAALLIGWGTTRMGPQVAFWVLAAMAVGAIISVLAMPRTAWNGRRAIGWKEEEPNEEDHAAPYRQVFANRRLFLLAIALALFNLSNGFMLSLLGQKLVDSGHDGTRWTAIYVLVAQGVMIPVALMAGSLADKRGRRMLLLVACAVLPVRALISAFVDDPYWLISAEILDGIASGVIGVAVPILVADLTWGSGRTQAALGVVNGIQGVGGALSGWVGGLLAVWLGWRGAFLTLALPAMAAFAMVLWLEETQEKHPDGADAAGHAASGGPA